MADQDDIIDERRDFFGLFYLHADGLVLCLIFQSKSQRRDVISEYEARREQENEGEQACGHALFIHELAVVSTQESIAGRYRNLSIAGCAADSYPSSSCY